MDKEDIESLGLIPSEDGDFGIQVRNIFDYWLSLEYFDEEKGWYLSIDGEDNEHCFLGYIRNKSELEIVLKQLQILK